MQLGQIIVRQNLTGVDEHPIKLVHALDMDRIDLPGLERLGFRRHRESIIPPLREVYTWVDNIPLSLSPSSRSVRWDTDSGL